MSKVRLTLFALFLALVFGAIGAGTALAVQSHMVNARNYLNSALTELEAAQADKGGHRNNAVSDVKSAIEQVNLGMQYAK